MSQAFILRDYQTQAVEAAVKHFRHGDDPAVIVLPTGAGKSLVIAQLSRLAKGRVICLAHVKELVEQNHGNFWLRVRQRVFFRRGSFRRDWTKKIVRKNNICQYSVTFC